MGSPRQEHGELPGAVFSSEDEEQSPVRGGCGVPRLQHRRLRLSCDFVLVFLGRAEPTLQTQLGHQQLVDTGNSIILGWCAWSCARTSGSLHQRGIKPHGFGGTQPAQHLQQQCSKGTRITKFLHESSFQRQDNTAKSSCAADGFVAPPAACGAPRGVFLSFFFAFCFHLLCLFWGCNAWIQGQRKR